MGAGAYPITIIVVVAIIIGIIFLPRSGVRQDRRVRDARLVGHSERKLGEFQLF